MQKRLKRPRDPAQLAKLIMDIATGEVKDEVEDKRNHVAVDRGKKGGAIGGKVRAKNLTKADLTRIGKKGAKARWQD